MSAQVAFGPSGGRVGAAPAPTVISVPSTKAAKLNRLRQLPPKPEIELDKAELKKKLTPLQYKVTQEKFTERPFSGEFLKLNQEGKYCCIVCDEELFSSQTKFDSGCGWPAFSDVINDKKVILQADLSHVGGNLLLLALNQDLARTEVICAKCGAHLGHVFDDGPKPSGKRYCVNSTSLRFEKQGLPLSCPFSPSTTTLQGPTNRLLNDGATPVITTKEGTEKHASAGSQVANPKGDTVAGKEVEPKKTPTIEAPSKCARDNHSTNSTNQTVPDSKATPTKAGDLVSQPRRFFFGLSAATSERSESAVERVQGPSDANNNRIGVSKYGSVKSRYLDHLDAVSKQAAERSTARKLPFAKPLLETHL